MNQRHLENIAEAAIQRTLRQLPEKIRQATEGCRIESEWLHELNGGEPGLDEDLLGLFEGASLADPESGTMEEMPRIRLFLDNLWEHSGHDSRRFREEVRTTLLHEIGHFLGLDEDQVAALGLA